jgi:hypothetical protein
VAIYSLEAEAMAVNPRDWRRRNRRCLPTTSMFHGVRTIEDAAIREESGANDEVLRLRN